MLKNRGSHFFGDNTFRKTIKVRVNIFIFKHYLYHEELTGRINVDFKGNFNRIS
jgi:hypothetical protein